MKKQIIVLLIISIILSSCNSSNNVKVEIIGTSTKYTVEEIEKAADQMRTNYGSSQFTVTKIYYNVELDEKFEEEYAKEENITSSNVLQLHSEVLTGDNPGSGYSANNTYVLTWVFVRSDSSSEWKNVSCGEG